MQYPIFLPYKVDVNEAGAIVAELEPVWARWYEIGDGLKLPAAFLDTVVNSPKESMQVMPFQALSHNIYYYIGSD